MAASSASISGVELIIVRHGRPERHDEPGVPNNPKLSALGLAQAEATAEFLYAEQIDAIVVSPMRRAQETAAPLMARLGLAYEVVAELEEVDAHRDRYIPSDELTLDDPIVQEFRNDPMSLFAHHGGFEPFRARVVGAFDHIVQSYKGKNVAVFCHGMVMASFLTHVVGNNNPFFANHDFCGISRVTASSSGFRTLRSINETGHVRIVSTGLRSPDGSL
jgi:2,3-bisphosphoglycerate-dependent phosphoglycerate mutase